ncbi:DEAD/DEAH box helicase [Cooperia oncophora]
MPGFNVWLRFGGKQRSWINSIGRLVELRKKERKVVIEKAKITLCELSGSFWFGSKAVTHRAGGLDLKTQEAALRSGPDVVVATPGRLIDHLHNSPSFSLNNIEVLVLDEADRMLEEAFKDQMNELIRLCAPNRQTLLFSATMTDQVSFGI